MRVVSYGEVGEDAWNGCVKASSEAWLFHDWSWVPIEAEYFSDENLTFAVLDGEEIVAVHPLYHAGPSQGLTAETILHSGFHRHAGLAVKDGLDPSRVKAARSVATKHLLDLADVHDVDRIHLAFQTAAPAQRTLSEASAPYLTTEFAFQMGLSFGPNGFDPCPGLSTLVLDQHVDLTVPEDALFKRLSGPCRRAVKQAEKAGLTFDVGGVEARLEEYMALATLSAARTGELLPPTAYYKAIGSALDKDHRAHIAFSRRNNQPVAALFLTSDKGVISFLAGVSDPEALNTRCNDHVHWSTILWAKSKGMEVYRLGPIFPEVPADWPIARVSAFKKKFGGRGVPIKYAIKFRRPEKYTQRLSGRLDQLEQIGRHTPPDGVSGTSLPMKILNHHLNLFGFNRAGRQVLTLEHPSASELGRLKTSTREGTPVIAVLPEPSFLEGLGIVRKDRNDCPRVFKAASGDSAWSRLRTLHPFAVFETDVDGALTPIVKGSDGATIWAWIPHEESGVLLIGTDLPGDLTRYRQGDPAARPTDKDMAVWGISGERPNYLFHAQREGEEPHERHADWWMYALRCALVEHGGLSPQSILPNDAPGVLLVTGDDDGATREHYETQCALLDPVPISYFTLPEPSCLDRDFMHSLTARYGTEWDLHPDAWHHPGEYADRLATQVAWFKQLSGKTPRIIRNHGFLNDGYWGHLPAWKRHGIVGSSNLPGFDGQVVNGSLLPARLAVNDELANHWSLLTLIGDGVIFAGGQTESEAAQTIRDAGARILDSGVPGVMCLNLHPANIARTAPMHDAVHEMLARGFIAMTFSQLLAWFEGRGYGPEMVSEAAAERPSRTAWSQDASGLSHGLVRRVVERTKSLVSRTP